MGIFSIHMTLAYDEGEKARERLLHALAIQKGDLSYLSFAAKPSNWNYFTNNRGHTLCCCSM
jgi:hypothetical protein